MSLLARTLPRANRLARVTLGNWPTPVTRLARLSRQLSCDVWAKRDDHSAKPYGGNKVRKLELLLADARERRAHTLVTVGGFGSNHLVATALYGARVGFRTRAVVAPQPPSEAARHNALLAASLDVELDVCPSRAYLPLQLARTLRACSAPYLIGPGGSSPLGTLGYVFAALELKQQILNNELPEPRDIFVPLGSGGTAAGLAVGCAIAGIRARLHAVRVVEKALCNALTLRLLIGRTRLLLRRLGEHVPPAPPCRVIDEQAGACYGHVTQQGREAIELLATTDGLRLEPTYSAKAMAALIAEVRRGGCGNPVLFWHTANSWDTSSLVAPDAVSGVAPAVRRWLEILDNSP